MIISIRSPGGTPVKDQKSKLNDKNSLEYALKKRFESMHSPTPPGSDDDLIDKENEFEDSIFKVDSPKKSKKSQRRTSGSLKSRNILIEKNKANDTPPVSIYFEIHAQTIIKHISI
jgi:hypothetical protein